MNHIEALFSDHSDPIDFAAGYFDYLQELMARLDKREIAEFIRILLDARDRGAMTFFIGNGGSAATASHFANDIAVGTKSLKPFRALSLTDNQAVITAIGNDFGYEDIFVKQLAILMKAGDVVVAISASGNSPNLLKAIDYANANGAKTVGLTGFDGGRLRALAQASVHVGGEKGEYGPVEDLHMMLDHLIGGYLLQLCKKERAAEVRS